MALHFSANQFNNEFDPRRLGNWELPRRYPQRPHARHGHTQIIANDRGHLLPGVPRPQGQAAGPWGNFVPTWRMPKRITRQLAEELRGPKPKSAKKKISAELPKEIEKQEKVLDIKKYFEDSPRDEDPCIGVPNDEKPEEKDLSYVPGDLTEPRHRPENYGLLRPKKEQTLEDIREDDMADKHQRHSIEGSRRQSPKTNPFACVYRNFEMAKKCHKENLEHHPLPDTVTDAMYRKLQMQRAQEPGLALNEESRATGVGWKGYGATGPTQCTKLRVYRPKTCANKKLKNLEDGLRPGSCGSFDLKWRFIKQRHVTPIELAICWDMTPENPSDEPKRTTHIDGSNGSAAPGIFAMVHSPKQPPEVLGSRKSSISKVSCDGVHGCGTIKSSSAGSQRSVAVRSFPAKLDRPKTSSPLASKEGSVDMNKVRNIDTNNNLNHRSISTNSLYVNAPTTKKPSKDSNPTFESVLNGAKTNLLVRRHLHQSSPNLSTISCGESNCSKKSLRDVKKANNYRPCVACDTKPGMEKEDRAKEDYKMAFKAGKLNESKSLDGTLSSGSGTRTSVKVPKQRDPYAKRNYDINSLHPPFSIWKGTSCQSYPEHWRLASIYQHSYKPVENRKKPLLASVYQ